MAEETLGFIIFAIWWAASMIWIATKWKQIHPRDRSTIIASFGLIPMVFIGFATLWSLVAPFVTDDQKR